ncbi:MAG: hypothetical protein OXE99_14675 [Cellvibrionales bacterium]|nr:hypothetical protein [Cellvibrionales bacterium]
MKKTITTLVIAVCLSQATFADRSDSLKNLGLAVLSIAAIAATATAVHFKLTADKNQQRAYESEEALTAKKGEEMLRLIEQAKFNSFLKLNEEQYQADTISKRKKLADNEKTFDKTILDVNRQKDTLRNEAVIKANAQKDESHYDKNSKSEEYISPPEGLRLFSNDDLKRLRANLAL